MPGQHHHQHRNNAGGGGDDDAAGPDVDPARPPEELLADLEEAIDAAEDFLSAQNFRLLDIIELTGFARNKAIIDAKEVINANDESRKQFQIIAREVFKKFKACVNFRDVNAFRQRYAAIKVIYNSLDEDVRQVDISHIMRELHAVVAEGIEQVAQRDILVAQGYEVGQGYLFSVPLPSEAFAQWVMARDTERCVDEGSMVMTAITDNLSRP